MQGSIYVQQIKLVNFVIQIFYILFFLKSLCIFLKIYLINLFIYYNWLHWVFVAAHGLSPVVASGGYSSSWCMGFSLRQLLLLRSTGCRCVGFISCGTWAQQLWLTGLVAPRHVGSSRTRARTRVPCIGRRILNHCATREALKSSIFLIIFCVFYLPISERDVIVDLSISLKFCQVLLRIFSGMLFRYMQVSNCHIFLVNYSFYLYTAIIFIPSDFYVKVSFVYMYTSFLMISVCLVQLSLVSYFQIFCVMFSVYP